MGSLGVVSYNTEARKDVKKVRLESTITDTMKEGYILCYNSDLTVDMNGDAVTAGTINPAKFLEVEKPAAGNLLFVAGVVDARSIGKTGGDWIYIIELDGSDIEVFTDQSCTIDVTELSVEAGSYFATANSGGVKIGLCKDTIDRSSTNGKVLIQTYTDRAKSQALVYGATSRTVVQLPTVAIWQNFDLDAMRSNPFFGSLLELDFRHAEGIPNNTFLDAASLLTIQGSAIGEMLLFHTTDNQAAEVQWVGCPITVSGGNPWAFEARVKQELLANTLANYFIGLSASTLLAGDQITDAAALADIDQVGYQLKEADGNAIDFVYKATGQTQQEHDDDIVVPVADTYNTFGMYFNGTTIQMFIDGVSTGTAISAALIAATEFPTASVLVPTFVTKAAISGNDFDHHLDWIRVAQLS